MNRVIFFLLFIPLYLSAIPQPNYPQSIIENSVNVITGDCIIYEQDLEVRGAEPIYFSREYINGTTHKEDGGWVFIPHLTLTCDETSSILYPKVYVTEPDGQKIVFDFLKTLDKDMTPLPFNFRYTVSKGVQSHLTLQHIRSMQAEIRRDKKYICIRSYNGCRRWYKKGVKNNYKGEREYHLIWEELPTGNLYQYYYDDEWRLIGIASQNPDKTKTYATCTLTYDENPKSERFLTITTSNNTLSTYFYDYFRSNKYHKYILTSIHKPEKPDELIVYTNTQRKDQGGFIGSRKFGNEKELFYFYYTEKDPEIKDPSDQRLDRVKKITLPIQGSAKDNPIYTFNYTFNEDGSGTTEVTDGMGTKTLYRYNTHKQIIEIQTFCPDGLLYKAETFVWGREDTQNLLQCYLLKDGKATPKMAHTYKYNEWGNLIEESTWGNIRNSEGLPLQVGAANLPIDNGVDKATVSYTYSQDGRNLLLSQRDENNILTYYTYLPNTSLIKTEETIGREKITYEYNEDNILIKTTRKNGKQTTTIDLDSDNRPETIIEPQLTTKFTYTSKGKVASKTIIDSEQTQRYTLQYEYDEKGNLTAETNPLGQQATATYSRQLKPTKATDPGGLLVHSFEYNKIGQLKTKTQTAPDGTSKKEHYTHNQHDKILTHIDAQNCTTFYTYDPDSNCTSIKRGNSEIRKSYNALGHLTSEADPEGNKTHYINNIYGKPLTITHPDGATEKRTYNLDGTLATATSPTGTIIRYTYDLYKRPLSKSIYSPENELLSTESNEYDAFNLIGTTDPLGLKTEYTYDDLDRKTAQRTGPLKTQFSYDSLGRLSHTQTGEQITEIKYDLLDREIEKNSLDTQGNLYGKIQYEYDPCGNKKAIHATIDGNKATQSYLYDPFNRPTLYTDPEGNSTTTLYIDNLASSNFAYAKQTTSPNGTSTTESYDRYGNLAQSKTHSSTGNLIRSASYEYNKSNQCTKQTDTITDENNTWTIITLREYNSRGNLKTLLEAAGTREQKKTTFSYDPEGRIAFTYNPNETTIAYTYNPLGKIQSLLTKEVSYRYHYDRVGRITQVDNLIDGTSTKRSYDTLGNVTSETLESNLTFQSEYNLLGQKTKFTLPDNSTIVYEYDPYHLRKIYRKGILVHEFYSYDLSGNLLSDTAGTYHYNLNGQKQSLDTPHYKHSIKKRDPMGNPLVETINNTDYHYTYNALSQLTSDSVHTYGYDSLDNRTSKDQKPYLLNNCSELLSTPTTNYLYDKNGNPIFRKNGNSTFHLTYDGLGRLTQAESPNSCKITFTYDGLHRRLSKTVHTYINNKWERTRKQYFLYDGDNEIGSTAGDLRILGGTSHAEIGSAVLIELDNVPYTPIYDLRGTLCGLANNSLIETTLYGTFGETLIPSKLANPWGYLSKRHDPELGLVFFGRRYLDTDSGRFITPDPAGFTDGLNLYTYCRNNPLTNLDLYGLYVHVEFHMDINTAFNLAATGTALLGSAIYNTSYHAIPIKPIRHLGMAIGNLLKRSKSPYESPPSTPNCLPGHIPKNSYTLIINGILTDKEQARLNAVNLSHGLDHMQVDYYHCTTRGFFLDILSASCALMGIQTQESLDIARMLHNKSEMFKQGGIDGHLFAIAHSRGGAYLANAIKFLTPEEQAMTHVTTFGSASLFKAPGLASLTHYVSYRDPVPFADPLHYLQARTGNHGNVHFLPSKGGLFDHSLLGPTYGDQLLKVCKDILGEINK